MHFAWTDRDGFISVSVHEPNELSTFHAMIEISDCFSIIVRVLCTLHGLIEMVSYQLLCMSNPFAAPQTVCCKSNSSVQSKRYAM